MTWLWLIGGCAALAALAWGVDWWMRRRCARETERELSRHRKTYLTGEDTR